jgi:hypothetical protein
MLEPETDIRAALDALPRFPDRAALDALRTTALEQRLAALLPAERARESQRWQEVEAKAAALSARGPRLERRAERPLGFEVFVAGLARLSQAFREPPIPEPDALLLFASDGDDAGQAVRVQVAAQPFDAVGVKPAAEAG